MFQKFIKNTVFVVLLLAITACATVDHKLLCQAPGAGCAVSEALYEELVIQGDDANDCLKKAERRGIANNFVCELPDGSEIDFGATFKLNALPEVK